jgi:DNA-binding NtrC family response regulator
MHETLPIAVGDSDVRPASRDLRELLDDYERDLILDALAASGGNQRKAAAQLGVLPTTLSEKMKRLGLRPAGGRRVATPLDSAADALAGSAAEA